MIAHEKAPIRVTLTGLFVTSFFHYTLYICGFNECVYGPDGVLFLIAITMFIELIFLKWKYPVV